MEKLTKRRKKKSKGSNTKYEIVHQSIEEGYEFIFPLKAEPKATFGIHNLVLWYAVTLRQFAVKERRSI